MSQFDHDIFARELNTKFRLKVGDKDIDLRLADVSRYLPQENEQGGMERFSLLFEGPAGPLLRQAMYSMSHETLGAVEIFIVPLAQDSEKTSYEAVFNYFKRPDQ